MKQKQRSIQLMYIEDVIKEFEQALNADNQVIVQSHELEPAEVLKSVDFGLFLSELDKFIKLNYNEVTSIKGETVYERH